MVSHFCVARPAKMKPNLRWPLGHADTENWPNLNGDGSTATNYTIFLGDEGTSIHQSQLFWGEKHIPLQLKFMTHSRRGYTNKMRGTSLAKPPFYVEKTWKNMVDPRFLQPKHQFLIIVVAQLLLENQTRFPPCRCSTARRNREESERADHQSRVTLAQLAAELTIEKPSYL